jgi:hypothetical protein
MAAEGRGGEGARERALVALLAALAAARVLALGAAFPFFTNVDEHRHVDLVLKYARGYLPRPGADAYEPETGEWVGLYGSPEYQLGGAAPPPPPPAWRSPPERMLGRVEAQRAFFAARPNLEAYESPGYYALAGAWLRLGRALGLEGARLLYWVRALGGLAAAALVLASHRLLPALPDRAGLVRLGLPLALALFPQDVLLYVTRDALSPLAAGAAFLWLVRLAERPGARPAAYAAAGLLAAAAVLVKYTNLPVLLVAGACALRALVRREGRARWALCCGAALLPVALWLARNQLLLGDALGSSLKVERMGWSRRPLGEWLDHPLLTASGALDFLAGLVPSFWRGELVWRRELLAWPVADRVYTATSALFLAAAALGLRRGAAAGARPGRLAEGLAWLAVLGSVALLAGLSLPFEFHATSNPSARRPFFDQGRLVCGALVPFLLLYLRGLEGLAARLPAGARRGAAWACLAAVLALATASELALAWPAFASPYNWFHLP